MGTLMTVHFDDRMREIQSAEIADPAAIGTSGFRDPSRVFLTILTKNYVDTRLFCRPYELGVQRLT